MYARTRMYIFSKDVKGFFKINTSIIHDEDIILCYVYKGKFLQTHLCNDVCPTELLDLVDKICDIAEIESNKVAKYYY